MPLFPGGYEDLFFYKIFMFLVGKSQEVAACKRALPSCHQSSSLHPGLLGWNPGPHTCLTSAVPGSHIPAARLYSVSHYCRSRVDLVMAAATPLSL